MGWNWSIPGITSAPKISAPSIPNTSSLTDSIDGFANQIANVGANVLSGGQVGYQDGKFSPGALYHTEDTLVGAIDGENAARKQQFDRNDAATAAAAQNLAISQNNTFQQQQATNASNMAASTRAAAIANSQVGASQTTNPALLSNGTNGNPTKDFLGL